MKKLFCLTFLLFSCATQHRPTPIIVEEQCEHSDSLIVKNGVSKPEAYLNVVALGTTMTLFKYPQAKPFLINTFLIIDKLLEDDKITYLEVTTVLKTNIKWVSEYINNHSFYTVIVSFFIDEEIPINKCDLQIFKKFVTRTLLILQK